MHKNYAFTFINGKRLESVFFQINITIIIFLTILRLVLYTNIGISDLEIFNGQFLLFAGFMPYAIISFIYPHSIFNKEYYRLTRFYEIPLADTFKYYLSQIYSKRNLTVAIGIPAILELFFFVVLKQNTFLSWIVFTTSFLLSFSFVSISFLLTLFFKKIYLVIKIGVPLFLYIFSVILLVASINFFQWYFILIVILLNGIVGITIYKLVQLRGKNMEV